MREMPAPWGKGCESGGQGLCLSSPVAKNHTRTTAKQFLSTSKFMCVIVIPGQCEKLDTVGEW